MIHETCVILNAQLPDEQIDAKISKLRDILTQGGTQITQESRWGKRKLAHPIGKANEGFYFIFFHKFAQSPGDAIKNFEKACGYDDDVLRTMTVAAPEKIKGNEIKAIVPEPGYKSEFSMVLRPSGPRRRFDRDDRYGGGRDRGGFDRDRPRERDREGGGPAGAPEAAETAPAAASEDES